jgi:cell division protein FtsW
VVLLVMSSPYQRARVVSFVNPWADPTGDGFQSVQGQIAIGSGGIFGRGLGNSIQKNFFLPEAHTDFIGAIVGEELGLVGLVAMIGAFVLLGVAGFRIALRAGDLHQRLLATGITSLICVQAVVNLGQVFGLLPVTGVPLPLVSAGGTSLVVFLAGIGILVNISRRGKRAHARRAGTGTNSSGDRGRRNGGSRQTSAGDRRRIAS